MHRIPQYFFVQIGVSIKKKKSLWNNGKSNRGASLPNLLRVREYPMSEPSNPYGATQIWTNSFSGAVFCRAFRHNRGERIWWQPVVFPHPGPKLPHVPLSGLLPPPEMPSCCSVGYSQLTTPVGLSTGMEDQHPPSQLVWHAVWHICYTPALHHHKIGPE